MSVWATSPLGVVVRHLICGFYLFISSSWLCCPLRFQNSPDSPSERVSWCLETSPLSWFPPRDGSPFLTLLSLFLSLYFVVSPFRDNGLPFWVPDVLCQLSEVVLWNLLSVQMIFGWICGGESGLPILFLHHLRATPPGRFFIIWASREAQWAKNKQTNKQTSKKKQKNKWGLANRFHTTSSILWI